MSQLIILTKNFKEALNTVSKELKLNPLELDFEILDVETKLIDLESNSEIKINLEELNTPYIKTLIETNRRIKIEQSYELSFFKKENKEEIPFSLGISKDLCSLFFYFTKEIEFSTDISFQSILKNEINKKKIKAGLLINIFEEEESFWKTIITKLKVHKKFNFENEKFIIAESFKPSSVINDKLKKLFETKKEHEEENNYKNRGFVIDIKENQQILEYIKPKDGTIGFSLKGQIIEPEIAEKKNEPTFKIGEGISFSETEEKIIYFATKSGFLNLKKEIIEIKNNLEINQISFKKTGNIEADLTTEINLTVKEKGLYNDAISGVDVEAKNIKVEGSIGEGTKISAETIEINEQIHANSEIKAKEIKVNKLKGSAIGEHIEVRLLEHGKIRGKKVYVDKSHGGTIVAEEVYINELRGNTKIMASKIIHIKNNLGEDNLLIINPFAISSITEYDKKIKIIIGYQNEINKSKKRLEEITKHLSLEKDKYMEIKTKQIDLKKKGITLPSYSLIFIKKYEEFITEMKSIKLILEEKEFQKSKFQKEIDETFLKVEDGVIKIDSMWYGYNKIIFKVKPGKELEDKTQKNETFKEYKVSYDILDEAYKIKKH